VLIFRPKKEIQKEIDVKKISERIYEDIQKSGESMTKYV